MTVADTDSSKDESPVPVELGLDADRPAAELLADLRRLLREGRTRMDAIADSLELSAVDTERLVSAAEQHGDVTREGYRGRDLYTIQLTEQGAEKLPPLSDREAHLARYSLTRRDADVLRAVDDLGRCSAAAIRDRLDDNCSPMALIPIVTHLVRQGYLDESGLLRRYVEVTDSGLAVLESIEREQ